MFIAFFTVCLAQGVLPPPDVLFSFDQIEGDKLLGDELNGTIGGSPTLERGQCGARWRKGNYYWFSYTR